MNKLIQSPLASDPNKQQPLPVASLLFIQNAYQQALAMLGASLIGDSVNPFQVYILWGCVKTVGGGNDNFTAGAIFVFGEIFIVPAASFATGTDYAYVLVANPAPDPIVLKDGTSTNVHNVRTAVISGTPASGPNQTALPNYSAWVRTIEAWIDAASFGANWSTNSIAQYRKNRDGLVSMKGFIRGTNAISSGVMFTLPVGYRPTSNVFETIILNDNSQKNYQVKIGTNGDVTMADATDYATNHANADISIWGINFYID